MFQKLKENLEIESTKITDQNFQNELVSLVQDLEKQYVSYKKKGFFVAASVLDPRYTLFTENIFDNSFKHFIPMIIELAPNESYEPDAVNSDLNVSQLPSDVFGHVFWGESLAKTCKTDENWKDNLEVTHFTL